MIAEADRDLVPRGDPRRVLFLLTRPRSFCPPTSATRRWRFMPFAVSPMTRSISATTSPPRSWRCVTGSTSLMRVAPGTRPPTAPFAALIADYDMPRELPEALLEGLAWDGMERRYATLSDLRAYSARVASAVGAMMCVLMRVRDPNALARACDLGVAMQLTKHRPRRGRGCTRGPPLSAHRLAGGGGDRHGRLSCPTQGPRPRSAASSSACWPRRTVSIFGPRPGSRRCRWLRGPAFSRRVTAMTPSGGNWRATGMTA